MIGREMEGVNVVHVYAGIHPGVFPRDISPTSRRGCVRGTLLVTKRQRPGRKSGMRGQRKAWRR